MRSACRRRAEGAAGAGGDAERHTLVDMRTDNLRKMLLPAKEYKSGHAIWYQKGCFTIHSAEGLP